MAKHSRRHFLKTGLLAGTGVLIGSSPLVRAASKRTLVAVSYGGAYQDAQRKAFFEPFAKETGVQIVEASPTDFGKIKAMVSSGNTIWDVVDVDTDWGFMAGNTGLLEPLDYNVIKVPTLDKNVVGEFSVGDMYWAAVVTYNTSTFPAGKAPKNWADVWDTTKFPGPRSLENLGSRMLPIALLADGVDPASLYPLDLERAFKSLDRIRSKVNFWFTTGSQSADVVASGQTVAGQAWSGRVVAARQQGRPIDMSFDQALMVGDSWIVPKGAPHKDVAMEFINFASQAERQAELAKLIPYGPTNPDAFKLIDKEVRLTLPNAPENNKTVVPLDSRWTAEHYAELVQRWNDWYVR